MTVKILRGDVRDQLATLPDQSVHCVVTSPPYWGLRDYGVAGQIGLEATPVEFVETMVQVFREVRRVLRDDGTLWLNLGDSYAGSWGAQGRPQGDGEMTGRSVTSARQIGAHPRFGTGTGTRGKEEGLKPKDLCGMPWRVAFALQADSWYLRQDIIWHKPNPMPESVRDRCTKAHEYIFLLSKSERYYFDADAIAEKSVTNDPRRPYGSQGAWDMDGRPAEQRHGGKPRISAAKGSFNGKTEAMADTGQNAFRAITATRNKRSVWTVATAPFSEAHFATFPPALIEPCILAGCPLGGAVLDPFGGAGTTGLVADRHGRDAILIELNPAYAKMAHRRIHNDSPLFAEVV